MIYIEGTTSPRDLGSGEERQREWERLRTIHRALAGQPRKKRNTAVEITCSCPKRHLLLSIHPIGPDRVALWQHGGGRIPPLQPGDPSFPSLSEVVPGWIADADRLQVSNDDRLTAELPQIRLRGRCTQGGFLGEAEAVAVSEALTTYRATPSTRIVLQVRRG